MIYDGGKFPVGLKLSRQKTLDPTLHSDKPAWPQIKSASRATINAGRFFYTTGEICSGEIYSWEIIPYIQLWQYYWPIGVILYCKA